MSAQDISNLPLLTFHEAVMNADGPGVYVLYRDGQPIYVGQSSHLEIRIARHSRRGVTHCRVLPSYKHHERLRVERDLIAHLNPQLNRTPGASERQIAYAFKAYNIPEGGRVVFDVPENCIELVASTAHKNERTIPAQLRMIVQQWAEKQPTP